MRLLKNTIGYRSPLSPTYNRIPLVIKSEELTLKIASLLESKYTKIEVEFI